MSDQRLVDQRAIARQLGVSTRRVRELVGEGLPRVRQGGRWQYPTRTCMQWLRARRAAAAARRAGQVAPRTELERAKLRLAAARAERAEYAERELVAGLLPRAEAEALVRALRREVANTVRHTLSRGAGELVGLSSMLDSYAALGRLTRAVLAALTALPVETPAAEPAAAAATPTTLAEARARCWEAQARRLELEAQVRDGTLVAAASVAAAQERAYTALRAAVLAAPQRHAARGVGLADEAAAQRALATIADEIIEVFEQDSGTVWTTRGCP